jgi:hypothetical protein
VWLCTHVNWIAESCLALDSEKGGGLSPDSYICASLGFTASKGTCVEGDSTYASEYDRHRSTTS